jgi:hypothetical protein
LSAVENAPVFQSGKNKVFQITPIDGTAGICLDGGLNGYHLIVGQRLLINRKGFCSHPIAIHANVT